MCIRDRPKHVLVPLDGSTLSEEVLPHAAALAKCGSARITLLRIVQPVEPVFPDPAEMHARALEPLDKTPTRSAVDDAMTHLVETQRHLHDESGAMVEAKVIVPD